MESDALQSVALALILVLGLLFALAFVLRRWRGLMPGGDLQLKTVSSCQIGPRERLLLVRLRDQEVLIGVSPGGIAALATQALSSDKPQGADTLQVEPSGAGAQDSKFNALLTKAAEGQLP